MKTPLIRPLIVAFALLTPAAAFAAPTASPSKPATSSAPTASHKPLVKRHAPARPVKGSKPANGPATQAPTHAK